LQLFTLKIAVQDQAYFLPLQDRTVIVTTQITGYEYQL